MDVILQIGDQTQKDREVNIPFLLEETPTDVRTPMSIDAKSMTVKLHPGKTKVALIKRPADYDGNMHPVRIVKFTHSDAGYEENMTNHVSSALLPGKKPNTLTTTVGFRSNVAPACRFEVDFDYKTGEVTVTDLGTDGATLKTVDLEYGYVDDRFDGITCDPTDEQPQKTLADHILSQHPVATTRECFLPIRENLQLDLPANRVQPYDAVSEGARILEVYTQDGVRIPVHFYPSSVLVANPSDDSGLTIQAALTIRPTAVDNVPNGDKIHLMVRIDVKTGVVSLSQDVVGSVSLKAVLLKYAVFEDFEAFFHEDDK